MKALDDVQNALELDDKNIKANLTCGQILCQLAKHEQNLQKVNNGINKIQKAIRLCSGQGKYEFEKELITYLLRAKKLHFYKKREID